MDLIKRFKKWLKSGSVESVFNRGYSLGKKHALETIAYDYKFNKDKFNKTITKYSNPF